MFFGEYAYIVFKLPMANWLGGIINRGCAQHFKGAKTKCHNHF
jgi:hypothetical protein